MGGLIRQLQFTDLLVNLANPHECVVKGAPGLPLLAPLPPEFADEIQTLSHELVSTGNGRREFGLFFDGIGYRVARIATLKGEWCALRRSMETIPSLETLGFPSAIAQRLCSEGLKSGLVVFCGRMDSGKTTSASSLVVERLQRFGGHAVALEDPPELPLHGWHGQGLCLQREVGDRDFAAAITQTLRLAAPEIIYIGELREPDEVSQALRAAINGHLIVSTVHSAGVMEAIQRLAALGRVKDGDFALSMLADGLSAIIHQSLESHDPAKPGAKRRLSLKFLFLEKESTGPRSKIRTNEIHQLGTDIQAQRNLLMLQQAR